MEWVSPRGGNWELGVNWSTLAPPLPQDGVEISTPVRVTLGTADAIAGLAVGPNATLNIISGGYLDIANGIDNPGTIQLTGTGGDPTLAIDGTVYLIAGGEILMQGPTANNLIIGVGGTSATLFNVDNIIAGSSGERPAPPSR